MISRRQLRFSAGFAGILLGLVCGSFASSRLLPWFWAVPLLVLAVWLMVMSSERLEIRRRERRGF